MRKAVIYILLGLLVSVGALVLWLGWRDPMQALPRPANNPQVDSLSLMPEGGRRVGHIVLRSEALGDIGFSISLPDPLPLGKLPLLFVFGGLEAGSDNLRTIENAGDNALIGYDWPIPTHFPVGFAFLSEAPELYDRVMSIPAQAATMMAWAAGQPWADESRISLLGYSLGALAAPAIQDMAAQEGLRINWTIVAYGGAPLGDLFAVNPSFRPYWLRDMMAPVAGLLLRPIEPSWHAPRLKGRFLVLEGNNDSLVPEAARAALSDAIPEPKEVVVFEGAHMGTGPDRQALLQKIIATSRDWLMLRGAVNRPAQ